jgi:hypothetical protein
MKSLAVPTCSTAALSEIDKLLAGEKFCANPKTFAYTAADLFIHNNVDPADVWIVEAEIPIRGFVWLKENGKWHRKTTPDLYYVTVYKGGHVLDPNPKWQSVLSPKDLEWEYDWAKMYNMADQVWVKADPSIW